MAENVRQAAASLAEFPMKGHIGQSGTREWVVLKAPRYLIIYTVAEGVTVLRVWHQSRRHDA